MTGPRPASARRDGGSYGRAQGRSPEPQGGDESADADCGATAGRRADVSQAASRVSWPFSRVIGKSPQVQRRRLHPLRGRTASKGYPDSSLLPSSHAINNAAAAARTANAAAPHPSQWIAATQKPSPKPRPKPTPTSSRLLGLWRCVRHMTSNRFGRVRVAAPRFGSKREPPRPQAHAVSQSHGKGNVKGEGDGVGEGVVV